MFGWDVGQCRSNTEESHPTEQQIGDTLRLAVEAVIDSLWDWNILTGKVYYSPQMGAILGVELSEATGRYEFWESRLHPDDKPAVLEHLRAHLAGDIPHFQIEHRLRVRSGQWKWVLSRGRVVHRTQDGSPRRMIGTMTDIDDRRQMQDCLQRAKDAAKAANHLKSEFLANLSHEIRTPMTAILGFSELLMMPNLPHKDQREFLSAIRRNGQTLLELISSILDLSRIETGTVILEKTDYRLRQMIDEVISVLRSRAEEKGLRLEAHFEHPLPETIHTDPMRLRQILLNLVGNAVKFTRRGAVRIVVRCLYENGAVARIQFVLRDTGIGIPPDKIDDIFQPFTQVDGSAARRYGGAGLGLAISKRLAGMLGADLAVTSELGTGSTFTLTLDAGSLEGPKLPEPTEAEDALPKEHPPAPHDRLFPPPNGREAPVPAGRIPR